MKTSFSVFVVISAFNEAPVIASVVADLLAHQYTQIIVVDDGSSDCTSAEAQRAGAIVLRHIINRGQGAGLKTGIEYARQKGADCVVAFDADGQHLASEVAAIIAPIQNGAADLVIGSRFLGKKARNMPWVKKVLLWLAKWITKILTGRMVTDSQSGLRAFSKRAMRELDIREERYANCLSVVEEAAQAGLKIVEVPVVVAYTQYSIRKGQPLTGGLKIVARLLLGKWRRD